MTPRSSMVGLDRARAGIAWGLIAGLVGLGLVNGITGSTVWAVTAGVMAAIGLVPPLAHGDLTVTPPWVPLGLAALAVVAGSMGIGGSLPQFLALASTALLVGVVVETTTAVEMTPTFAVTFVVLTTMASAGLWTIGEWATEVLLTTSRLGDRTEVARTLGIATLAGIGAGVLFELGFRTSETASSEPVAGPES